VARSASGAEADCSDRDYTDDALKQMGRRAEDAARQERLRRKTAHEAWQGAGAGRAGAAGPHEAPGAAEEAAEEAPEVRVWGLEAHGFRALLPGRWPPRGTLPQVKAKLPVPLTPRALGWASAAAGVDVLLRVRRVAVRVLPGCDQVPQGVWLAQERTLHQLLGRRASGSGGFVPSTHPTNPQLCVRHAWRPLAMRVDWAAGRVSTCLAGYPTRGVPPAPPNNGVRSPAPVVVHLSYAGGCCLGARLF
jgi:hypothetical protein